MKTDTLWGGGVSWGGGGRSSVGHSTGNLGETSCLLTAFDRCLCLLIEMGFASDWNEGTASFGFLFVLFSPPRHPSSLMKWLRHFCLISFSVPSAREFRVVLFPAVFPFPSVV